MRCKYIKSDGTRCKAYAMKNSEYCFSHNPEVKEEKALAVRKGGLNRRLCKAYGEPLEINSPEDIKNLLADVINGVWCGDIPENRPAATLGFLSRCFLSAYEKSEMEERIKSLEELLDNANY